MWQSGLIFAVLMLLAGSGFSLLTPLCVPCLSLFIGLLTGYVAGVFDKPADNGAAAKKGAIAGAIAGIGAILGQAIGGVLVSVIASPQTYGQMVEQWGLPFDERSYWVGRVIVVCCGGIFDLLLMVGLGALGGLLWWQMSGKKTPYPTAPIQM